MKKAFTLIELLVVVAIVAALAGILFPVISQARRSAHQAVCLSNLRQCGNALLIYDSDSQGFPVGDAATAALAAAPTCDHEDTWRASCAVPVSAPRIGSYGYVRLCPDYADEATWGNALSSDKPPSLLISINYGARQVKPFSGMSPDYPRCLVHLECAMPDRIPAFDLDGSSKRRRAGATKIVRGVPFQVFTWPSAFEKAQTP